MRNTFLGLAALPVALIAFNVNSSTASAQEKDGGTDAPPKVVAKAEDTVKSLDECRAENKKKDLTIAETLELLHTCEGKLPKATTTEAPPRNTPTKWHCAPSPYPNDPAAGCYESGNDVLCRDTEHFVSVPYKLWTQKSCVRRDAPSGQVEQKKQELLKNFRNLCADPANHDPICDEVVRIDQHVSLIQVDLNAVTSVWCPEIPGEPGATMLRRCQVEHDRVMRRESGISTTSLDLTALVGATHRGAAGWGGDFQLALGGTFYPDPLWRVALRAELVGGQFVGGSVNGGGVSSLGASVGPVIDLTADHRNQLALMGSFTQYVSDNPAGSNGVALHSTFIGYEGGVKAWYRYNFQVVHLGVQLHAGTGNVNYQPEANSNALLTSGFQAGGFFLIGLHPKIW